MIEPMTIEVVYTTESTATGGGRDGHVKSADGRLDLDTRPPKALGGSGEGTNPEQLFSAGYAACFLGALRLVAGKSKVQSRRRHQRDRRDRIRQGFRGRIRAHRQDRRLLARAWTKAPHRTWWKQAHQVCPYSKATRGNIDVEVSAKV